jgi:hypothetical protein
LCVYGKYVRTKTTGFQAVTKVGQEGLEPRPTDYEGGGLPHYSTPSNRYDENHKAFKKKMLLGFVGF